MDLETFREYCLAVKGAGESLPFLGNNVLVFKVMGKMFAMVPLEPRDGVIRAHMKCDAEYAAQLRESYGGIGPGFDPRSDTWYTLTLESDVPERLIRELIGRSVSEVIRALPKYRQEEYRRMP
ncbi:MAG: MmcQ/YjbR family DNA-binding protein [Alistipes sp.]|nr:MmcQ/YjbR family DNA-binding protein [Alistipes sp.]